MNLNNKRVKELFMLCLLLFSKLVVSACTSSTSAPAEGIDVSGWSEPKKKLICVSGKVLRRKDDHNIDVSGYKLACVRSHFQIQDSMNGKIRKKKVECVVKCPDKTSDLPTNARNSHFRNSIAGTGKQTVECDDGYHPKSKQGYKCSSTGNWQTIEESSSPVEVSDITDICVNCIDDHSLDSIKIDVSNFISTRQLSCQEGYDLKKKDETSADVSGYKLVCVGSNFQIQDSNANNAIIPKSAVECVSKCKGTAAPADGIDVSNFISTRQLSCQEGYDLQNKDDTSADVSGYKLVCVGSNFQIQDSNPSNAKIQNSAVECVSKCKDKKDDEDKESHFTIYVMQDGTQTVVCDEGYQKAGTKEYVCEKGSWKKKEESEYVDINNICIKKMTSAAYSTTLGFLFVFSFVVFGGLVF